MKTADVHKRPAPLALRPLIALAVLGLVVALGSVFYIGWRQNVVVPPVPTSSPPATTSTPEPTPVVVEETTADRVGDAPADRDIVAVHTSVGDGTLRLRVTLAGDWPDWQGASASPEPYSAFFEWAADRRPGPDVPPSWAGGCNPWIATYQTVVGPNGLHGYGQVQIDGRDLTLVVPLSDFENPHTLGVGISLTEGDTFPDEPASDECHYIPLPPETSAPTPTPSPTTTPATTPTPAPTPVEETTTDRIGDAPADRDIVAVHTSVADGTLRLQVTLANDWADWEMSPTSSNTRVAFVNWNADHRVHSTHGFVPGCRPDDATYRSLISREGVVTGYGRAQFDGRDLILIIPLSDFENPHALGVSIELTDGDTFPDVPDSFPDVQWSEGCHYIPLPLEPSAPTPAPTPAVVEETTTDRVGDASPPGRDIVAVTTSVAEGTLTLAIELADDWAPSPKNGAVFIDWVADRRLPPGATGFSSGACNPWIATYRTLIDPTGRLDASLAGEQGVQVRTGGKTITVAVPLAALEHPNTLGFAITLVDGDTFPDEPREDGCHYVPLPPESIAPTPTPSPTAAPSTTSTPAPTPVTTADRVGDAPSDRDIVAVHTSVDDGTLTLRVTLADDWPTDSQRLAFINWLVDGRPYEGAIGFSTGSCNPYIATYRTVITRDGRLGGSLEVPAATRAHIDGPWLLLVLPLELLDEPNTLGIEISIPDGDTFPDDPAPDGCHHIPLTP